MVIEVRVAGAAMLQVALAGPLARVAQNVRISTAGVVVNTYCGVEVTLSV